MYKCPYCVYTSKRKYNVEVHVKNKHAQNLRGSGFLQNEHTMHQTPELNACIRQWQAAYQNVDARYKQSEKEKAELIQFCNAQYSRTPTTISVGPDCPKAPTTVSVPPLGSTNQYGAGVDMDNESDDEYESEENEDEENEERSFWIIASELRDTFNELRQLRTEYRQALPQLKELTGKDLKRALETYAWLEATVHADKHGLEKELENVIIIDETKEEEMTGKGVDSDTEGETDEESVDDPDEHIANDTDTEDSESNDETDEETVDSDDDNDVEDEEKNKDVNENDNDDPDTNAKEEGDDDFWDFILEARGFIENKTMLEKYVTWAKTTLAVANDYEKDQGKEAKNSKQVFKDLETVLERFEEHGVGCFEQVSNRKIHSLCRIAEMLADTESQIKKTNLNEYKEFLKMMGPKLKSYRKLVDPNISIHKKRSELKKVQVGTGILDAAVNLLIPMAMKYGKKRKYDN